MVVYRRLFANNFPTVCLQIAVGKQKWIGRGRAGQLYFKEQNSIPLVSTKDLLSRQLEL